MNIESSLNIISSRTNLLAAVTAVVKVTAVRRAHASAKTYGLSPSEENALRCVRIAVLNGKVLVSATDFDQWLERSLSAVTVLSEGSALIPPEPLIAFLKELTDETVSLLGLPCAHGMHVTGGRVGRDFLGYRVDRFPPRPAFLETRRVVVDCSDLRAAIKKTRIIALHQNKREGQYAVSQLVHLAVTDRSLGVVATDAHRIVLYDCNVQEISLKGTGDELPISKQLISPTKVTLSRSAIQGLEGALGNARGDVIIGFGSQEASFHINADNGDETTVISRVENTTFPDYERIIPKMAVARWTFNRNELLRAVREGATTDPDAGRLIMRPDPDGNRLRMTAGIGRSGDFHADLDMKVEGEGPVEVAFNCKYLEDILEALTDERCYIQLAALIAPGVVKPHLPEIPSCPIALFCSDREPSFRYLLNSCVPIS